ncbi:hypothetical protein GGR50DRAFT_685286 [Xylaria sp. CBS 124048]|nr:hypothetical protein GGR50DRAFT_685286 [Xylaria sp. CBS 124048]
MRFSLHPQAKFDPIPPDLDLHGLVDQTPNFDWVTRISLAQLRRLGPVGFEKLVQLHVIEGGRPLVIEGWDRALPKDLFSVGWLMKTCDKKQENVRDITAQTDIPMTTGHYLRSMKQLASQWTPTNFRDERRQRLYLKDIDCPDEWFQHLQKIIPPIVFYMNGNVSENMSHRPQDDDIFDTSEKTPAIAGDLMSSLDPEMRAQNLMCYIGHEGTYTPAHQEMCASLGQNIMVEASGDKDGELPGSSIWFMTETKDREVVREYFLSMLGHDVDVERHFAQINAWKKANFPVYIVEQKVGDFILVPPLAPHQVWNRGTRTMKVAWNRTTVETIDLALHEALPKARLVCRDEQYKNKAVVYYTLQKYYKELRSLEDSPEVGLLGFGQELTQNSARVKQMARDFKKLFGLFTEILVGEMFGSKQMDVEYVPFDSNITCSYCRSNIFNRFLTCKNCVREVAGEEDTYDVCMECYAMGRSCLCVSGLQWCEQWKWSELVEKHEAWRALIIEQDGFVDIDLSPQPLELARRKTGKKSVAQVCQEQLRRRPWNDITKAPEPPSGESEPEVDEDGRVKKKARKRKLKKIRGDSSNCHVCSHRESDYKLSFCTTCPSAYCYGVLWRAFDMMPQSVMEQERWQCPKCLKICNCGGCRPTGNTVPYIPKGTLLGHDTRPIADDRSVESIVDFRLHNLSWLMATGEGDRSKDTKRMNRLRQQADAEKAKDPLASLDTDGATHEMDAALQDSVMSGYDDQGLFVGQGSQGDQVHRDPSNPHGESGNQVKTANVSGLLDGEGSSIYPDPSGSPEPAMRGRMMGMGFYDQDESTDKILFDVFKLPTAEALNSEPQVSDFVKKTLRLAKRKARLEQEDDPDFQDPVSHRKKPRTGNIEQLVNLDPALLGALGDIGPTPVIGTGFDHSAAGPADSEQLEANQDMDTSIPLAPDAPQIDPLRLSLRHAKPMASYVEAEEPLDDADDMAVMGLSNTYTEKDDPNEPGRSAVDLAADAVRSLTSGISAAQQESPKAQSTPRTTGKRRGRPPRNSLGANSEPTATEPTATETTETESKKRGRPPRSSLVTSSTSTGMELRHREEPVENSPKRGRPPRGSYAHDSHDSTPTPTKPKRRGRPPRNSLVRQSTPTSTEPKRRGRPPRSALATTSPSARTELEQEGSPDSAGSPGARRSTRTAVPSTETREIEEPTRALESLSLAERMALRGKKIRIRGRGSARRTGESRNNTRAPTTTQSRDTTATPAPATAQSQDTTATSMDVQEIVDSATPMDGDGDVDSARNGEAMESRGTPGQSHAEPIDDDFEPSAVEGSPSVASLSEHDYSPPERTLPKRDGPTIVRFGSDDDDDDSSAASAVETKPRRPFVPTRGRGRGRWATRGRA